MPANFKLEFSEDDLTVPNASATWVDVTALLHTGSLKFSGGVQRPGDGPRAGEMSFTLEGNSFLPLNADSPYYPNVVRRRRFRYSVLRGLTWEPRFLGYARTFQPVWPENAQRVAVEIVCGDGGDLLSDSLPKLDPPEAEDYEDVVQADQPWGYWRLGEPEGTRATARVLTVKRGKGKKRRKVKVRRGTVWSTRAEAEGVSGPAGTYKNTPTLGQTGAILGDPDTSVTFNDAQNEWVRIPVEDDDLVRSNKLSIECWVYLTAYPASEGDVFPFVAGPSDGAGDCVWKLWVRRGASASFLEFELSLANGGFCDATSATLPDLDEWAHVVGTFDGTNARLYLNGTLLATASAPAAIATPAANPVVSIARWTGLAAYHRGGIDEVAAYERALNDGRVLAHHTAGTARGFPQQTAGERIAAVCDRIDVWDTSQIAASSFQLLPTMMHGQSHLEVIVDAVLAEGQRSIFGFDGNGDPFYLPWEFQSEDTYSTVQATFGAPPQTGEIPFDEQQLTFDDRVENSVTKARAGSTSVTVTDEDSIALLGSTIEADPEVDLPLVTDLDVEKLCQEHLAMYAEPCYVVEELDLDGVDEEALDALLDLPLGSMVRFKRRTLNEDGTASDPVDVITWIVGYDTALEPGLRHVGKWYLARGFNAAEEVWRMGITGYSEIGETTVLG